MMGPHAAMHTCACKGQGMLPGWCPAGGLMQAVCCCKTMHSPIYGVCWPVGHLPYIWGMLTRGSPPSLCCGPGLACVQLSKTLAYWAEERPERPPKYNVILASRDVIECWRSTLGGAQVRHIHWITHWIIHLDHPT